MLCQEILQYYTGCLTLVYLMRASFISFKVGDDRLLAKQHVLIRRMFFPFDGGGTEDLLSFII